MEGRAELAGSQGNAARWACADMCNLGGGGQRRPGGTELGHTGGCRRGGTPASMGDGGAWLGEVWDGAVTACEAWLGREACGAATWEAGGAGERAGRGVESKREGSGVL